MTREQRTGDWAAWMAGPATRPPAPSTDAPAPAEPVSSVPGPARNGTAVAFETQPADAGVHSMSVAEHDDPHACEPARSARREATRQRILDAAREVFAERGVIGGTVEDICERAGFTRGAFYSNFTDKDDVLTALVARDHEVLVRHLEGSFEEVVDEIAAAPDLAAAAASIVERLLHSIPLDRQLSLVQAELEIYAVRRPDSARTFIEANARFRERIAAFIEVAMGRIGRELLVSPGDLTDTLIAVAERSVRRALLAGRPQDIDAMSNAVLPGILLALSRPVDR